MEMSDRENRSVLCSAAQGKESGFPQERWERLPGGGLEKPCANCWGRDGGSETRLSRSSLPAAAAAAEQPRCASGAAVPREALRCECGLR